MRKAVSQYRFHCSTDTGILHSNARRHQSCTDLRPQTAPASSISPPQIPLEGRPFQPDRVAVSDKQHSCFALRLFLCALAFAGEIKPLPTFNACGAMHSADSGQAVRMTDCCGYKP